MKMNPNLKGFVTYSSENYGIAVDYAASLVQKPCIVIISRKIRESLLKTMKRN
jgi:threonine dehydratase